LSNFLQSTQPVKKTPIIYWMATEVTIWTGRTFIIILL